MALLIQPVVLLLSVTAPPVPGWNGPVPRIWNDEECPFAVPDGVVDASPAACTARCTAQDNCTAINWNSDPAGGTGAVRCQLRACNAKAAPVPTWSVPYWVGYASFKLPPPPPPTPPPPPPPGALTMVKLTEAAASDGAVCLDGSSPVYYFRPGSGNGSTKFILFLEGGGWCAGLSTAVGGFDSCLSRSKGGLGSSNGYGPTMGSGEAGNLFSQDPAVNPTFWNWNVAYAKYCDGASFSGNRSDPVMAAPGQPLFFRGARVFAAVVDSLKADHGMASATDGLLSGCSAGGLATYHHCDAFAELIAPAKARCAADAGYFADIASEFGAPVTPNPRHSIIEMEYSWVFDNQQSNNSLVGLNQNCLAAMGRGNPLCFFPENALKHMTTPMFVLNSGYDSWQTNFIWFTPDGGKPVDPGWHSCAQVIGTCNASQLAVIETFHDKFVAKLAPMVDPATPHGGFVESCMGHCQAWPTNIKYNGMSGLETLSAWHQGRAKAKVIDSPLLSGKGACQPPKP